MATKANRRGKHGASSAGPAVSWLLTRVALPLALLYGLLWWRADAAVEKQLDRLRPYLEIQRGTTVLGLNGDIGFRRLLVQPLPGTPFPALTLSADRAVVHTPGLWWLVRSSLFGIPDGMPSRFGFSLANAGIDGSPEALQATLIGGHVLFPFDLAGCEPGMSLAAARELGLDQAVSNFSFMLRHETGGALKLRFDVDTASLSAIAGSVELVLGGAGDAPMQLANASFHSLEVAMVDQGFIARRNAYCASKLGVEPAEFVQRHLEAVRALFAADGLVPGAAMSQAYAGFSESGGRLLIQARPLRPGPFLQLRGVDLDSLDLFFDGSVKHNDNFTAPLVFMAADEVAGPVTSTPAPDAGSEVVVPVAAASQAATGTAQRVAPGEEIAYDDLPGYLGAEVEVETTLGTVRRGLLTGASSISIVIKLVAEEGGFPLSLPKYNIVKVRLAPPLTETPDSQANAQAQ